jgi:hypothetical protein
MNPNSFVSTIHFNANVAVTTAVMVLSGAFIRQIVVCCQPLHAHS